MNKTYEVALHQLTKKKKKILLAQTEDVKVLKASQKVCLSPYDLKREQAGVEPPCFQLLLSKHRAEPRAACQSARQEGPTEGAT